MTLCELFFELKIIERVKGAPNLYRCLKTNEEIDEILKDKVFWVCQGYPRGIKPSLTNIKRVYTTEGKSEEYSLEAAFSFRGKKEYIRFCTCSIGSAQIFHTEDECIEYFIKSIDEQIKPLQEKRDKLDKKIKELNDEIDKYAILL